MEHPYGFPDVVLDRIFSNQSYEDLKRGRLVCKKWDEIICDYHLNSRTKIGFDSRPAKNQISSDDVKNLDVSHMIYHSNSSESFYTVFDHSLHNTPFNAFLFKGQSWNPDIFSSALKAIENSVTDLSLIYISLSGESALSTLFKFDNFNPKNLTKLYIKSDELPITEFQVDCDKLVSIQILILSNCTLIKSESLKNQIFIKELHLEKVTYGSDFVLNEAFNFTKADKIVINQKHSGSDILLDLGGSAKLKTLELYHTPATNWETCKWEVQNCIVDRFQWPLVERPIDVYFPFCQLMNIKCLTIEKSMVDLTRLPNTIEKLVLIKTIHLIRGNYHPNVHCTNLKSLTMELSSENVTSLHHFYKLPTLVDLTLYSEGRYDTMSASKIPKTIKRLSLERVEIVPQSELDALRLDSLTLNNYSFQDTEKFIGVKTKQLIISNGYISQSNDDAIKLMEKWKPHVHTFIIGQFNFLNMANVKSLLSTCVDRAAPYYIFQGGKGIGISAEEFSRLTDSK